MRNAISAERTRNRLLLGAIALVRLNLTGWSPALPKAEQDREKAKAVRAVKLLLREYRPRTKAGVVACTLPEPLIGVKLEPGDEVVVEGARSNIEKLAPAFWHFEMIRADYVKITERLAATTTVSREFIVPYKNDLPGFGNWQCGLLYALLTSDTEARPKDLTDYAGDSGNGTGCRRAYKRLGAAPLECYKPGAKPGAGRMRPRSTYGTAIGRIVVTMLMQRKRFPDCPYIRVHDEVKARALAAGRAKAHAENLCRRAMLKAIVHDVLLAANGRKPDYAGQRGAGEPIIV